MSTPGDARFARERIEERLDRLYSAIDGRTSEGKWVRGLQDVILRALDQIEVAYDVELEKAAQEATQAAERTERVHAGEVKRLTGERDRAQQSADDAVTRMKQMEVDNTITFDETGHTVEITPPKNRYGRSSAWTVEVLEESMTRLRIAGAGSKTPVDLGYRQIKADVREPLPPSAEERAQQAREAAAAKRKNRKDTALTATVWVAGAAAGVPLLLGIWWVLTVVYGFMLGLVGL